MTDSPADWPIERRVEYLQWAELVVNGCLGVNHGLELRFHEELQRGRNLLG